MTPRAAMWLIVSLALMWFIAVAGFSAIDYQEKVALWDRGHGEMKGMEGPPEFNDFLKTVILWATLPIWIIPAWRLVGLLVRWSVVYVVVDLISDAVARCVRGRRG